MGDFVAMTSNRVYGSKMRDLVGNTQAIEGVSLFRLEALCPTTVFFVLVLKEFLQWCSGKQRQNITPLGVDPLSGIVSRFIYPTLKELLQ